MRENLKQYTEVDIHKVNYFDNLDLFETIKQKAITKDKGAWMTSWYEDSFQKIANYIIDYINSLDFIGKTPIDVGFQLEHMNLWGQIYNENDYQDSHDHVPYNLSWIYFVNTPNGSSPVVFEDSDLKVIPREGKVLVFPSWVRHYVPPNKCKGRAIIAGNISYKPTKVFGDVYE